MLFSVAPRQFHRQVPLLLGLLLVVGMSVSLAWQTVDWIRLLRTPPPSADVNPQAVQHAPAPEQLASLFGASTLAGGAPPPTTNLRLTLRGSFVHTDPQRSSAIVQREGSQPKRFVVGAELDSGIRLHAVYRDRIELERNGRLETLLFPTHSPAQQNPQNQALPQAAPVGQLESLEDLEEDNTALLRERMDALRQQMEAAGIEPDAEPTAQPTESD